MGWPHWAVTWMWRRCLFEVGAAADSSSRMDILVCKDSIIIAGCLISHHLWCYCLMMNLYKSPRTFSAYLKMDLYKSPRTAPWKFTFMDTYLTIIFGYHCFKFIVILLHMIYVILLWMIFTISYQPGSPVWRYSVHIVNNSHCLHSILFSHKCRIILSP